jgi:hypothetical protein
MVAYSKPLRKSLQNGDSIISDTKAYAITVPVGRSQLMPLAANLICGLFRRNFISCHH